MFFKNKKKEEKKELLYRENIRVNCKSASKEEVIRQVGEMLVKSGYVDEPYVVQGGKRKILSHLYGKWSCSFLHGVEAPRRTSRLPGCSYDFQEGVDWNEVLDM